MVDIEEYRNGQQGFTLQDPGEIVQWILNCLELLERQLPRTIENFAESNHRQLVGLQSIAKSLLDSRPLNDKLTTTTKNCYTRIRLLEYVVSLCQWFEIFDDQRTLKNWEKQSLNGLENTRFTIMEKHKQSIWNNRNSKLILNILLFDCGLTVSPMFNTEISHTNIWSWLCSLKCVNDDQFMSLKCVMLYIICDCYNLDKTASPTSIQDLCFNYALKFEIKMI
eukprot:UN32726